jgi:Sap, sulfolipid-1-addressing protein
MSVSRVRENLTHGSTRRREETNANRSHRAAPGASRRPDLVGVCAARELGDDLPYSDDDHTQGARATYYGGARFARATCVTCASRMLHAAIQVLLYGLLAGLSPLAFAATLAVMPAGRLKALGFGTGFVVAQVLTCSVFVIIGIAATGSRRESHPGIQATLEVLLALALTGLALRVRRRPPTAKESSNERMQALLERLGRLRFLTTVVAGFLLGIGGPKRLVLTGLAATTIVIAGVSDAREAVLVVVYVAVATALVWGPVILVGLLGKRAVSLMEGAQGEVGRRQPRVTVYALLVLAALLIIDAIAVLLT